MYKVLLILKYLRRRRIAWVSLIAVTMCTALMLVVISVMGGWLRMFRQSFHGLSGDVQVQATSMQGFPYYQEMVKQIDALPFVGTNRAAPVVRAFGLINLNGQRTQGVEVEGYPIDIISNVNDFDTSLYREHISRTEAKAKLSNPKLHLTPQERKYFTELADDRTPPSFAMAKTAGIRLFDDLPANLNIPADLQDKLIYLPSEQTMLYRGEMSDPDYVRLLAVSNDPAYQEAIGSLYRFSDPQRMFRKIKNDVRNWPGMILGDGVAGISKENGNAIGRDPTLWRIRAELMVAAVPVDGSLPSAQDAPPVRPYWIVDDSRTKVYQIDSNTVYVPFEVLQQDLEMSEKKNDDGSIIPARTSEIDIRIQPGKNLDEARTQIAQLCNRITDEQNTSGKFVPVNGGFNVETWEQRNSLFLGAVEHEEVLMLFLFGMISVVAVFLIFCIFYMIVVEKTRDIGIIKSVGATSGGVAGIFLGYGLAIGLVGSGMGFLFGWLIVHYINQIHAWMGRAMGIVIWDPKVYLFDSIPNTMNPREVAVILSVAVLAAVLGALLPAIAAASLNPVESLRWE